jgi:hypothetical protein
MKRLLLFGWLLACVLLSSGGVSVEPVAGWTIQSQTKETVVYTTKTGEKYHRDGCRYLRQSKIKTTKKEAIKNGYGACKVCKP